MKICAVQLNPKSCRTYIDFYSYLEQIFIQTKDSDLLVFPENINFCLLFYKPEQKSLSIKLFLENLFDKVISNTNISFILKKQNLDEQKNLILDCFSSLAKKYNTNVITGSFYEKKDDGIYNSIYAINRNGNIVENTSKKDLVGLEKAFRIKSNNIPKVADFDFGRVGLCICFDLNDPDYCSKFDCDILVAPSNGYRPFPGYPFDYKKETPQLQIAKDNNYNIVRPYCAGWLVPIYFAGRTMIVDRKGNVVAKSKSLNKSENVIADLN